MAEIKLFTYVEKGGRYVINFNSSPKTQKFFPEFTKLLSTVSDLSYDTEHNGWSISKHDFDRFVLLNDRLFKPKKTLPKVNKIIQEEKKEVSDYDSMGSSLKLQPYDYQKEVIKYIIDNRNVLVVAPCGSGK